ncbi:MAG: RagB/SusD family nutrient uptake outer membrane protein [Parabacteroides sp.]|nr:RagB/SusD family nutrient uptake outer membrane protein [Parabacteroides sp.]
MNKNILIVVVCGLLGLIGCNDDFLDKYPETSITEVNYFNNASDLELYSNQFYNYFLFYGSGPIFSLNDYPSDNMCSGSTSSELHSLMSGAITPLNATQWDWSKIRNVNFMIARAGNATGDNVAHYIGLARMTRACLYYFEKVLRYSDVPWYSHDLQTTDTKLLYKTQDPRSLVVDSVMADFDFAVKNMNSGSDRTLLSKEVALAYLARTALFEGSWRKYHSELGLTNADSFFEKAVTACEELMNSGTFSLNADYEAIFRNNDLKGNPEIILYQDFNYGDPNLTWWNGMWYNTGMLSRDLMETYLYIRDDKAVPFTSTDGYKTKSFDEFYKNRDSRLSATFWTPGFLKYGWVDPAVPDLANGGYGVKKYEALSTNQNGWGSSAQCYADLPIIRYAEILLMYAEAKAELGVLTQADLDKSVNLLRDRAGVPRASLSDWLANVDPVLVNKYPNVQSSQKGAVLEVRRERRVELAIEGFREKDLKRWACGDCFDKIQEGIYFPGFGLYDLNADGNPDILIVAMFADKEKYADEIAKYNIFSYVIEEGNVMLTEGTKGYIKPAGKDGVFNFESPKHYYYPVSEQDITINPNLVQNSLWK